MRRDTYVVIALGLSVVVVVAYGLYYTNGGEETQIPSCNRTDLVGAFVKNSDGDVIGIVSMVEDAGGQSFAIINHGSAYYGEGGGYTPVPVGALKIEELTMEQSAQLQAVVYDDGEFGLEAAPPWDPATWAESTYQDRVQAFFGVQPVLCS